MLVKIVLNKCYGGFMLSVEAKKRLVELGCPHMKPTNDSDGVDKPYGPVEVAGKRYYDNHGSGDFDLRTCPHLIHVVETMGDRVNGPCSCLEIEEIDVCPAITNRDGKESMDSYYW